MKHLKIEGLVPAVFTPFDSAGNLNLKIVPHYAEYLIKNGASGVFVCGTTGECVSMTLEERKLLLNAWIKAVSKKILVIAHVGSTCQKDSIVLAEHALSIGADAVGSIAPSYFLPKNIQDLIDFYKPVAKACYPLPFYSYHMPSITGLNLSMKDFLLYGKKQIPNLNGIKFTSNNFMEMMECICLNNGEFDILNGFDEMLLCGLSVGAKAGVGSTYNYSLYVYQQLIAAFLRNDIEAARQWQIKSIEIVNLIIRHGGGVRGGKAIMKFIGLDCGNCRPPFSSYSKEELSEIERDFKDIDLITV